MPTLLITIIPSLLIVSFFVFSDKFKEPKKQIIKIFGYGVIITFIAGWLNYFLINFFSKNFGTNAAINESFLSAAFVEEGLKFLVLFYFVYEMKDFNERMDGLVYGICVSLGFATLENIDYVYWQNIQDFTSYEIAIWRSFSAIPAHGAFGLIMGYFFMKYSFVQKKNNLLFCFLFPYLLHGSYNYFLHFNFYISLVIIILAWIVGLRLFFNLKDAQKRKKREYERKI